MRGLGVDAPQQRVVVIGQGYVGLPMAMLAVEAGYTYHDAVDYSLVEREARWILDCRNRMYGAIVEFL
jgi:glycine/D-amino acid oxidase-like deaminating enzyme